MAKFNPLMHRFTKQAKNKKAGRKESSRASAAHLEPGHEEGHNRVAEGPSICQPGRRDFVESRGESCGAGEAAQEGPESCGESCGDGARKLWRSSARRAKVSWGPKAVDEESGSK